MSCDSLTQYTGKKLLFVGTASMNWGLSDFHALGDFCALQKVDAVFLKVADGGIRWYGGMGGYHTRREIIRSYGVSVIPYTYMYGDRYGALYDEIDILISLLHDGGIVCADMEAEWNGEVAWAEIVTKKLLPVAGVFLVSTWADPLQQQWGDVIKALDPCVNGYMPQVYTTWLSAQVTAQYRGLTQKCVQPTITLNDTFGNPLDIARMMIVDGCQTLSIWYDELARQNPRLLQSIYGLLGGLEPMHNWYDVNPTIKASLDACWESTASYFGGTPPRKNTGIHSSWVSAWIDKGFQFGPPLTQEYKTTDWNGLSITVQQFAGARCEWDNTNHSHWYTSSGKVYEQ